MQGFVRYPTPVLYSGLGASAPQKMLYKPGVDSILGVSNQYEFMISVVNVFEKKIFKLFRDKVNATLKSYPNFMAGMQAVYVDNRVCKVDAEIAWKQYGVMSNFNMLIAYVFYFERNSHSFFETVPQRGILHLSGAKRSEINWEYIKQYHKIMKASIGCSQWFCYNPPEFNGIPNITIQIP